MPAVLGVDLGATNLRVALGDGRGAIAARAAEPVPATGEALAARVAAIARELAVASRSRRRRSACRGSRTATASRA